MALHLPGASCGTRELHQPCAHQQRQTSELARRTWQELARWAMAAHQQQNPASAPAPASRKRPYAEHEEQAKRSRPLAELQADAYGRP